METMQDIIAQEMIEMRYNRKHIDLKIKLAIEADPIMLAKVDEGVKLINEYLIGDYYESKKSRIKQLSNLDINDLVKDLFTGIAYFIRPELFTSVTAQMAARLKFSNKTDAIATVAELLGVLCKTDAFDIIKESRLASMTLVSNIDLPSNIIHFIEHSQFLPPMVCSPLELTHNFSSGYLTHNDSLLLGNDTHHDGDLCLDVLNLMNNVPLRLNTDFLSHVEEEPTFALDTQDKADQWSKFKSQSYHFYTLMVQQGNKFYFNHKVDKRGRIYSQGYHINPQGTAFKKAQLEFFEEQIVTGIPT